MSHPLTQLGYTFTGFIAAVLLTHLGTAYPMFRGGVLLLNVGAILLCAAYGCYCWYVAKSYKVEPADLVNSTLPSALAIALIMLAMIVGVWTA